MVEDEAITLSRRYINEKGAPYITRFIGCKQKFSGEFRGVVTMSQRKRRTGILCLPL